MQLREYIEQFSQDERMPTRNRIEEGRQHLFDFEYPIFDEEYRNVFETHFIRTFYMREIGFETEGLFKFNLETWLLVNMPYYNKLFESELLTYDPLTNVNEKVTHNREKEQGQNDVATKEKTVDTDTSNKNVFSQTSSDTSHATSETDQTNHSKTDGSSDSTGSQTTDDFSRHLESDTPDSRLTITSNDGQGVIEYASKITEDNSNGKTDSTNHESSTQTTDATQNTSSETNATQTGEQDSTSTDTGTIDTKENDNQTLKRDITETEDYVQNRVGKIGTATYPQLVKEYREALLRIEKELFNEMNHLFMLVY